MSADDLFTTCRAMARFGGGFMSALSAALQRADAANAQKLLAAFPEIAEKYGPGTHPFREVSA